MPWHVTQDADCPADEPWAVVKDDDGSIAGCHATEAGAEEQMAALYAQEQKALEPIREFRVASEAWPEVDLELRADGDGLNFRGYAAVFGSPSEDLGGFREVIAPGAFAKTLAERGRSRRSPIKMFLNHDWDVVLASTYGKDPTLRLTEDARGLFVDADLPDNEWGRPVRDAIKRGDISSMSFGFNVTNEAWDAERTSRTLLEVRLWEVSPVTAWPAYPATSVGVRRLARLTDTDDDALEAAVRVLFSEAMLDADQHHTLLRAINARFHSPLADEEVVALRARLLAKRPDYLD